MVRLGGAASPAYINVFRGLQSHFKRQGIKLDAQFSVLCSA